MATSRWPSSWPGRWPSFSYGAAAALLLIGMQGLCAGQTSAPQSTSGSTLPTASPPAADSGTAHPGDASGQPPASSQAQPGDTSTSLQATSVQDASSGGTIRGAVKSGAAPLPGVTITATNT